MRETSDETIFEVAGRGELHLTILIENDAPRGLRAGRLAPARAAQDVDGVRHEPYEMLTVDVEDANQGR